MNEIKLISDFHYNWYERYSL